MKAKAKDVKKDVVISKDEIKSLVYFIGKSKDPMDKIMLAWSFVTGIIRKSKEIQEVKIG